MASRTLIRPLPYIKKSAKRQASKIIIIIIRQEEEAGVLSGVIGKQTLLYETLAYVNDCGGVVS